MVKTSYGIVGKDIGVSDKNCGIKKIDTGHIVDYINKSVIIIPEFQRELQENKINEIYNEYIERHKNGENYFIKHGYFSLCKIGNTKELYLIDGQHRLEALKRLYIDGYNPDILVRIQLCNDIEQMKQDFKLLNCNSNIPIIYTCFENKFIQESLFNIKSMLKEHYSSGFNNYKNEKSKSNRLHMDDFLQLFNIEKLKKYKKTNKNTIYNELMIINHEIKKTFDNFSEKEIRFYINNNDLKKISDIEFYLSLKNIDWIEKIYDKKYKIKYNPVCYKKSHIPKSLSIKVYHRDFGNKEYVGYCYVCKNEITRDSGHMGHIIPEYLGGETTLNNLKAICSSCNLSMGIQNLFDYKKTYF